MNIRHLNCPKIILAATVAIFASPFLGIDAYAQAAANPNVTASVQQADGMKTITFHTADGTVDVTIPDDAAAADTISGTVIASPKASSAEELSHYADELNSYHLELDKANPLPRRHWHHSEKAAAANAPVSSPVQSGYLHSFAFLIPAAGGHLQLILKAKDGTALCTQDIPYAAQPPEASIEKETVVFPPTGECGRPLRLKGHFDGNFSSSHVAIGGKTCTILAESPRQLICRTPKNVTGRTKIECRVGGKVIAAKFKNSPPSSAQASDLLDLSGGWSGTIGPITITQSGPFVAWDTGSIRCWGTVSKDTVDFEFHNYRYESRGKGHLGRKNLVGYNEYLEGYTYKTSVDKKPVSYPKHACHLYR